MTKQRVPIVAITIHVALEQERPLDEIAAFVVAFRAEHGRLPTDEEGIRHFGETPPDPRADKPWPEAEDCSGCDRHRDGPHRFGCKAQSAQLVLPTSRPPGDRT